MSSNASQCPHAILCADDTEYDSGQKVDSFLTTIARHPRISFSYLPLAVLYFLGDGWKRAWLQTTSAGAELASKTMANLVQRSVEEFLKHDATLIAYVGEYIAAFKEALADDGPPRTPRCTR